MKVSQNFDIREFVPRSIWNKWGTRSTWFIEERVVKVAQFYKDFFTKYYKNKHDGLKTVSIVVNTWHYIKGGQQNRGFRTPSCKVGASMSQHRFCNAFDCDVILVFKDGRRVEANYKELHKIIKEYEDQFMGAGLSCLESVKDAPTWLHSDCRWMPNQKGILTVKYKKK